MAGARNAPACMRVSSSKRAGTGLRKACLTTPRGTVNVLNLVQGDEVLVESPTGAFAPFAMHYAETFIVPAAIGRYTIRPVGQQSAGEYATLKAAVRS